PVPSRQATMATPSAPPDTKTTTDMVPASPPATPTPTPTLTPNPHPALTTLETLPLDILFHLATYLPYPTLLFLSCTSRPLHAALNPDALRPRTEKIAHYLLAERHFPQHAGRLACLVCFQFKTPAQFGDSKRRGPAGRCGGSAVKRGERFCWDCGVRGRLYIHLRGVLKGGVRYYPCHRCGEARVESQRCLREVCVLGGMEGIGGDSRVENLPRGVVERVCGLVGYGDLIKLKMVSRYFRGVVDPVRQCRDVYGMWEFVMEKILRRGVPLGRWDAPRVCFGCFRPRKRVQFSENQYHLSRTYNHGEYWRRRCWECLRRFYHPQLADTEARERFHRQVMCGTCRCLRFADEDCWGCEVNKDKIAEWTRMKRLKMAAKAESQSMWDNDALLPVWWEGVASADQPESDDLWEEGLGLCFDRLGFGDDHSLQEDGVREQEALSPDVDDPEPSSTANSNLTTIISDVRESGPREDEAPFS
ncbi:hypothetical protein C8A01DRAFT_19319, partial [Parachaetomium inaequale]